MDACKRNNFERIVDLFHSIKYFAHWAPNEIKKLEQYFQEVSYQWGNTVFKYNEAPQYVYIIKEGEFEIFKKNQEYKDLSLGLFRCTSPVVGYNPLGNRMEIREVKLANIGKGNMIGEYNAINNINYTTTVRCAKKGTLFRIKTEDFIY